MKPQGRKLVEYNLGELQEIIEYIQVQYELCNTTQCKTIWSDKYIEVAKVANEKSHESIGIRIYEKYIHLK